MLLVSHTDPSIPDISWNALTFRFVLLDDTTSIFSTRNVCATPFAQAIISITLVSWIAPAGEFSWFVNALRIEIAIVKTELAFVDIDAVRAVLVIVDVTIARITGACERVSFDDADAVWTTLVSTFFARIDV